MAGFDGIWKLFKRNMKNREDIMAGFDGIWKCFKEI